MFNSVPFALTTYYNTGDYSVYLYYATAYISYHDADFDI